jgi:hypothetical protein
MQSAIAIAVLAAALLTGIYLHALVKLYGILKKERPDWVERKGSLSFFYSGLPRIGDPNVGAAVVGTAFSSRIRQLHSPRALSYAKRIRICLPVSLALYLFAMVAGYVSAA